MKATIEIWKVKDLLDSIDTILEQPKYQRGDVWSPIKKQMLIDSMMRGFDIPKIYLRRVDRGQHKYEVADGQQRIIAIREFSDKILRLSSKTVNGLDLSRIGHYTVGQKDIEEINSKLVKDFLNYELTIAIVDDASNPEIRVLFGRLQMGDPLNPAEKRNAIISRLGSEIDNIVLNHDLFTKSKIKEARYKRQDYVTHAIALIYYKNLQDLKAPLFSKMYFELATSIPSTLVATIVKIFGWMHEIDKMTKRRIVNKWSFIDIFFLLYDYRKQIASIDYDKFGQLFTKFELSRIKHSAKPEVLISGRKPSEEEEKLYNYILAFKSNGGNPVNLKKRLDAFKLVFKTSFTFK